MDCRETLMQIIAQNRAKDDVSYIMSSFRNGKYGFAVAYTSNEKRFFPADSMEEMEEIARGLIEKNPLSGRFHTMFFNINHLRKVEMAGIKTDNPHIALRFEPRHIAHHAYVSEEACREDFTFFANLLSEWQDAEANTYFDLSVQH